MVEFKREQLEALSKEQLIDWLLTMQQGGNMNDKLDPHAFRIEPKIRLTDGRTIGSVSTC